MIGFFVVRLDEKGVAETDGVARIRDGTSNTVLVAEAVPTAATCADADGNGRGGVTMLHFAMRDARTGQSVPVSIIPNDGDVDDDGRHATTIGVGPKTFVEDLTWRARRAISR